MKSIVLKVTLKGDNTMLKKLSGLLALCAFFTVSGCSLWVSTPTPPPQTTVEAENNLTSMSVDVSGVTTDVNGIDLEDVSIGDVSYSSILYGTTSSEKVTDRSGNVTVTIGTALVSTQVLNQTVTIPFSNISPMSTTITPETLNTVVFKQTTAGVIFQALAKKKA
jgi:hypothetical protein